MRSSGSGLWVLVAVAPSAVALIVATSGPRDIFTDPECIVLGETDLALTTSGVIGTTLGPTLRAGIDPGFQVGALYAVQSNDRHFEGSWYAISSLVRKTNGDEVGIATWLSPHLLAVWSGGQTGIGLQDWAESPARHPEQTYVFAANRVAAKVSIWTPAVVKAAAEEPSRRCVLASRTQGL